MDATWRIQERAEVAVIAGEDAGTTAKQAATELAALFAPEEGTPHGRSVVA
jgi:hypothetical protein